MDPLPPNDNDLDFGAPPPQGAAADFQATNQIRDAVLRFLEAGSLDNAASLIASSGAEVGDALLDEPTQKLGPRVREALADAFFRARDFDRAARAAERVEDPDHAARILEASGQFARAAALRERLGQRDRAAELYARGGDHERAAQLFALAGMLDRAAEAYERADKLYDAGRLWARQRRLDRALEVLQRVDSASDTFVPAMHLLGRILEHTGHPDAAAARYLDVIHARPLDSTTVDIHERLIELYVRAGNVADARRLISKVLRFEPSRPYPARALGLLLGKGSTEATMRSVGSSPPPGPGGPAPMSLPSSSGQSVTVTAINPVVDRLRQLPLFAELSLGQLRALHGAGSLVQFRPGDVLIEQDQEGAGVFVLLSGTVQVVRVDGDDEVPLTDLRYGAFVGEMALLDQGPTSARVRAVTEVQAFRWPIDQLRRLMDADERTALRMLRVVSRALSVRLRETSSQVRKPL